MFNNCILISTFILILKIDKIIDFNNKQTTFVAIFTPPFMLKCRFPLRHDDFNYLFYIHTLVFLARTI